MYVACIFRRMYVCTRVYDTGCMLVGRALVNANLCTKAFTMCISMYVHVSMKERVHAHMHACRQAGRSSNYILTTPSKVLRTLLTKSPQSP